MECMEEAAAYLMVAESEKKKRGERGRGAVGPCPKSSSKKRSKNLTFFLYALFLHPTTVSRIWAAGINRYTGAHS